MLKKRKFVFLEGLKRHSKKNSQYRVTVLKEKLITLENYQAKSTIVSPSINEVDVITLVHDENQAFVNFVDKIDSRLFIGGIISKIYQ